MEQRLSKLLSLVVKGEGHGTGRHTSHGLSPDAAAPILLEMGELAMEHGYTQIATECLRALSVEHLHSPDHLTRRQLLSAREMVGDNEAIVYTKSAVEVLCIISMVYVVSTTLCTKMHDP